MFYLSNLLILETKAAKGSIITVTDYNDGNGIDSNTLTNQRNTQDESNTDDDQSKTQHKSSNDKDQSNTLEQSNNDDNQSNTLDMSCNDKDPG